MGGLTGDVVQSGTPGGDDDRAGPLGGLEGRTAGSKPFTVMSKAEPGTGPATFRAAFAKELSAQRERMGPDLRKFVMSKATTCGNAIEPYAEPC